MKARRSTHARDRSPVSYVQKHLPQDAIPDPVVRRSSFEAPGRSALRRPASVTTQGRQMVAALAAGVFPTLPRFARPEDPSDRSDGKVQPYLHRCRTGNERQTALHAIPAGYLQQTSPLKQLAIFVAQYRDARDTDRSTHR